MDLKFLGEVNMPHMACETMQDSLEQAKNASASMETQANMQDSANNAMMDTTARMSADSVK